MSREITFENFFYYDYNLHFSNNNHALRLESTLKKNNPETSVIKLVISKITRRFLRYPPNKIYFTLQTFIWKLFKFSFC